MEAGCKRPHSAQSHSGTVPCTVTFTSLIEKQTNKHNKTTTVYIPQCQLQQEVKVCSIRFETRLSLSSKMALTHYKPKLFYTRIAFQRKSTYRHSWNYCSSPGPLLHPSWPNLSRERPKGSFRLRKKLIKKKTPEPH